MIDDRPLLDRAQRYFGRFAASLRAVRPRLQGPDSHLGHEVEVARTFIGRVARARRQEISLDVELPEALRQQRFPAGLLLPLLRSALAVEDAPGHRLLLAARRDADRVRVRLEAAFAIDALDVESARGLVSALYGPSASVVTTERPAGDTVIIELPCQV